MSNGLNRAAGSPVSIEIGGQTYIMEPLTLRDFGTLEAEYLKNKPNPLKQVAEAKEFLNDEDFQVLLTQAYRDAMEVNKATSEEIAQWLDTPAGISFSAWISMRKNHPELSREEVDDLLGTLNQQQLEHIAEQRDVASGTDELGNSTGRTTGQRKTKTTKTSSRGGGKGRGRRAAKK